MTETSSRRTARILACVLAVVLLVAAGGLQRAIAREEDPAGGPSSTDVQPAPRQGIWVDLSFGTDIDRTKREVVDPGDTFAADGGRVYCLTRVHGMSPPATVTHVWYYEGRTMARVDLAVGSENWRTWSYKTYQPEWTGPWEVKVLDEDGMVLGSAGFEVK